MGEKFFEPTVRPVTTWAGLVDNRVRKLFRRPGRTQTIQLGTAVETETALPITIRVPWAQTPNPEDDLAAYAAATTSLINRLHEMVEGLRHDLLTEVQARDTAIKHAQATLTADIDQVRLLSRQVAVGGLRLQVVGWLFLLAGIVVGTIANVIGS